MSAVGAIIDGEAEAGGGRALLSDDPACNTPLWQAAEADAAQIHRAVEAARRAQIHWQALPFSDRADYVHRFADLITHEQEALTRLIAQETGKVLWDAAGEANAMAAKAAISITAYGERTGEHRQDAAFGQACLTHRAHGVFAVLGPYNFPGHLPNGHIIPALLAGNSVVFKPSELTPAVGQWMVEKWHQAGLPPGVVNLVQGGRDVAQHLLNQAIDGVLFTGSARTGTAIHRHFAGRPDIILALEMGGNNPLVAWDVTDAGAAATIIAQSAYLTSGQRCSCARRLIIPDDHRGAAILEALTALIDRMRIGAWDEEPEPFFGPLISNTAADAMAKAQDARIKAGGQALRRAQQPPGRGPAFLTPALIDVTEAALPDEEIFGPLLHIIRANSLDQALTIANDTRFGLSAALLSDNESNWQQFAARVRAGIINWNRPTNGAASNMPFGGPGLSGNARPSAYYAADYCAWPAASQQATAIEAMPLKGLNARP